MFANLTKARCFPSKGNGQKGMELALKRESVSANPVPFRRRGQSTVGQLLLSAAQKHLRPWSTAAKQLTHKKPHHSHNIVCKKIFAVWEARKDVQEMEPELVQGSARSG